MESKIKRTGPDPKAFADEQAWHLATITAYRKVFLTKCISDQCLCKGMTKKQTRAELKKFKDQVDDEAASYYCSMLDKAKIATED
jgi:hypothetical protein